MQRTHQPQLNPTNKTRAATHPALAPSGLIFVLAATAALAAEPTNLNTALRDTHSIVDLRLRSEHVAQEGLPQDASAVSLRGRLGFETGKILKTSLLAEAELVWPLDTDYNSTTNGKTAFPIIADPETHEINRLQLTNTSLPATTLILGRQRINLDDQRFVGAVGWRQNEQTFDAFRIVNTAIQKVAAEFVYIDQVNRVFGKDSPVGRYTGDSYLANLAVQTPLGKLSGFTYLLDFEQAPGDSSQTYGVRFAGKHPLSTAQLSYSAAYASQREYAGSPLDYSNNYYLAELTATLSRYSLGAGVEVLEGDGNKGFATPLATLHKFQGWTDKFLATPANGIEDRYVSVGYTQTSAGFFDAITAAASYHRFDSERLGINYGSEANLQLEVKRRRVTALLKYADYRAEAFTTDTRKWWLQFEYVR